MSKNKKEIPLWARVGHSKPVTRREMLACGLIPFAGSLVIPTWMSFFLRSQAQGAEALNCPPSKFSGLIPMITVNLQGGAALSSNYVPLNEGRDLLPTYRNLGMGDNKLPIEREFGNVPFPGLIESGILISQILAGIRSSASRAALDKTAFIAIPCHCLSDTGRNLFDVSGLVTKAGLIGSHLPNLGSGGGLTGISQLPARVPPPTPLSVSGFGSMARAIAYSDALNGFTVGQKNAMAKLMRQLTFTQVRKLANIQGAEDVKKVLECGGVKNVDIIAAGTGFIDPRLNAEYSKVWGLTPTTDDGTEDMTLGSMVYSSLLGYAGSCNIQLGGYDYHDGTRTTANRLDHRAGVVMGRILESAHVLKKPTFLYITSDGSVSNGNPEDDRQAEWTSDRNQTGMAYLMYYNPKGRPETSDFQIGHFTAAQAVDRFYLTGGNPEVAAAAVFANWCQANKRNDLYVPAAGDRILDTVQLKQVIKVA